MPGTQMVPDIVPASLYGIDGSYGGAADYYARVLARICQAALDHRRDGGLLVNYRELPQAVFTTILPHFGMTCSEQGERDLMAASRAPRRQGAQYRIRRRQRGQAPCGERAHCARWPNAILAISTAGSKRRG